MKEAGISLMVFDLDGVIVNSEPAHEIARQSILQERFPPEVSRVRKDCTGISAREEYQYYLDCFQMKDSARELEQLHYARTLDTLKDTQPVPTEGLLEVLEGLKERGIALAVASTSPRFYVEGVLAHFGLMDYFSAIACGDQVKRAKPDPAVYLLALSLMGTDAGRAAALEDSRAGLMAAKAAGLYALGFHAPGPFLQDLSLADGEISSMKELLPLLLGESKISNGNSQNA